MVNSATGRNQVAANQTP